MTNDSLSPTGSASQRFARQFCGFDPPKNTLREILPQPSSIFALQVLDFIAIQLGMPKMWLCPRWSWPAGLTGKRKHDEVSAVTFLNYCFSLISFNQVIDPLSNWPMIPLQAARLSGAFARDSVNVLQWINHDPLPVEDSSMSGHGSKQLVALYQNFVSNFKRTPFSHILSNFKLAAFMLGWYFQVSRLFQGNQLAENQPITGHIQAPRNNCRSV